AARPRARRVNRMVSWSCIFPQLPARIVAGRGIECMRFLAALHRGRTPDAGHGRQQTKGCLLCDRGGMDFLRIRTVIAGSGWVGTVIGRGCISLASAAFFVFVVPQFGFWPLRPCVPTGRIRIGSLQNPGCGAVRSDAVALRTYETSLTRRQTMQKGTVKWFNPTKGYGFIRPSTGEKDVFVHISAVERAGLSTLNEGQTVEYELVTNRGKTSAENLKVS